MTKIAAAERFVSSEAKDVAACLCFVESMTACAEWRVRVTHFLARNRYE